jgi:hypothetical protein
MVAMASSMILLQCGGKATTGVGSREVDAGPPNDAGRDVSIDAAARIDAPSEDSSPAGESDDASLGYGVVVDASGDWTLPNSGGPTWRTSTSSYCNPSPLSAPWIWSDERGVFAASGELMFNDGTGWSSIPSAPYGDVFTGVPHQGPLIFYGGGGCGARFFDGQTEQCIGTVPLTNVYVADAQHIYAVTNNRVLIFNGSYFIQYGGQLLQYESNSGYQLWGTADGVVFAGDARHVYVIDGPAAASQVLFLPGDDEDSGTAFEGSSLWGFSRNDIWVGGADGRLAHYDGSAWSVVQAIAPGPCSTIAHLWGAAGVLFFASSTSIGRWQGGTIDVLFSAACTQPDSSTEGTFDITDVAQIWGNSTTEVFFVIQEYRVVVVRQSYYLINTTVARDACGLSHVYWFDGHALGLL